MQASRWILTVGALLATSSSMTASPAKADEPRYRDIGDLFGQACIANRADPEAVANWARSRHLEVLTNPRGLQVFAGAATGTAWQLPLPSNAYVLALRGPARQCAVYAARADPTTSIREFQDSIAMLPIQLGHAVPFQDRSITGPYGKRTMKVFLGLDPANRLASTMMVMVDQNPGGTFRRRCSWGAPGWLGNLDDCCRPQDGIRVRDA